MKTEDFERLKKLCDENGFELVTESPKDNDKFFVVKKKRIKVDLMEINYGCKDGQDFFSFTFSIIGRHNQDLYDAGKFLAEQLEKYLNNEIE